MIGGRYARERRSMANDRRKVYRRKEELV